MKGARRKAAVQRMETASHTIPAEIVHAYYPSGVAQQTILSDGKVNTTLKVVDNMGLESILQRLNPMFDACMAEDYAVVSRHLQEKGWEIATPRASIDGRYHVRDTSQTPWRSFTYIASDGEVPTPRKEPEALHIALSGLLGSLHNSLAELDYIPAFSLPHFHQTEHYAAHLEGLLSQLPSNATRTLGANSIRLCRERAISPRPEQLIHGDPKLANALYRGGMPFTFVDFDTLMRGNPLIDVGDMLRSITGKLLDGSPEYVQRQLTAVIAAYYEHAKPSLAEKMFEHEALAAARQIALELGIRYLIDSVEAAYFDWDPERYESRTDHNIARAQTQWDVHEMLS